ncbi:MAG: hypothetical protein IPP89_11375 [Saprospiraceae bacterium]|nr:hypothetical protein [Candidatus Brachybacter algidus]MBL0119557.1 hypothetical protein [Candidatus Brachybacter algidus]
MQQNNYKPITSPSGGELISAVFNIVFNLTNHKFEYYLNMPVSAPSGQHCPDIIDSVKVGVADIEPPKPNAGQDQNTCAFSSIVLNATPAYIPFGTYGYWEVVSQNPSGMHAQL